MRKEFHSTLLGTCIGERNLKAYIQYIATLFFVNFYISFSSILTAIMYEEEIEGWGWFRRGLYFSMSLGCLIVSGGLVFLMYGIISRLRRNITWEEAKIQSFHKKVVLS